MVEFKLFMNLDPETHLHAMFMFPSSSSSVDIQLQYFDCLWPTITKGNNSVAQSRHPPKMNPIRSWQHQSVLLQYPQESASEINAMTNATILPHTVLALYFTPKETCTKSPPHANPKISTRVRPWRVIKQKVRDDQAMSNEEGCANSDCDDPSYDGEMVHCAGLSCLRQEQWSLHNILTQHLLMIGSLFLVP